MSNGYLIVKCLRCGSISQLELKAVRSNISLCPVCSDCELECVAVQCTIQVIQKHNAEATDSHPYLSVLPKFSVN